MTLLTQKKRFQKVLYNKPLIYGNLPLSLGTLCVIDFARHTFFFFVKIDKETLVDNR